MCFFTSVRMRFTVAIIHRFFLSIQLCRSVFHCFSCIMDPVFYLGFFIQTQHLALLCLHLVLTSLLLVAHTCLPHFTQPGSHTCSIVWCCWLIGAEQIWPLLSQLAWIVSPASYPVLSVVSCNVFVQQQAF